MATRPSFNERRKLALADFREQAIEQNSQLSSLFLEMPNGEEFEIPNPMLLSDEAQTRVGRVQNLYDLDRDEKDEIRQPPTIKGKPAEPYTIRVARALLGEEAHKKFIAAGGHSNDITLAWQVLVREHEARLENDPK